MKSPPGSRKILKPIHVERRDSTAERLLRQSQAMAEELQRANAELQEKAQLLAAKNREVELAKKALEEKAAQLSLASRYKSEFLANMSHELRTPLNNLLILSRILSENSDGNLTTKQVKFADTIHTSGTDLLALINDILDLSKIESGKMEVDPGELRFVDLQEYCLKTFRHIADSKGLEFTVALSAGLPEGIQTDINRIRQVMKNLLSNALKFTAQGSVTLTIGKAVGGWTPQHSILSRAPSVIAFSVRDTGIGIAPDKQRIIFEAFQQADGTTSRKYGGTGLGLSISRELTGLLGGEIHLESVPGAGSSFTLYLPETFSAPVPPLKIESEKILPLFRGHFIEEGADVSLPVPLGERELGGDTVDDDRRRIEPGDPVLLIVDGDVAFARTLVELARKSGWKALATLRGNAAIALARRFRPGAVTLDIYLPDIGGWALLDRFKHDPLTRHIPVHVISNIENRGRAIALGAASYRRKAEPDAALPELFTSIASALEKRFKHLLLICSDRGLRRRIETDLVGRDVVLSHVSNSREALAWIRDHSPDGIVMELDSVGPDPMALARELRREFAPAAPPMLMLAMRSMPTEETAEVECLAQSGAFQVAPSLEQLLDASMLLFHRDEAALAPEQRQILEHLRETESELAGRTVLIVDDDVRNIFALTSLLEDYQLNVLHAESGSAAIELLERKPEVDLVLMDIMIPEMDGYETMKAVRKIPRFTSLPLIALTAKMSTEDREKCLDAGASDSVTKPVDLEQLFSVLRVWLKSEGKPPAFAAHGM